MSLSFGIAASYNVHCNGFNLLVGLTKERKIMGTVEVLLRFGGGGFFIFDVLKEGLNRERGASY